MRKMMFLGKSEVLLPLLVLLCLSTAVQSQDCPLGQVKHTWKSKSNCCETVFNCPKNHHIIPCTEINGSKDVCSPCDDGFKNYHVTSSVDPDWMKYRCYKIEKHHSKCSPEDHVPFSFVYPNCAMYCECDQTKCFYGTPCGCDQASKCGQNEELNMETGACEPCRPHTYKNEIGCQPCTWNETSWRLSFPGEVEVGNNESPSLPGVTGKPGVISAEPGVIVTTKDSGYKIPDAHEEPNTGESTDNSKDTNNEGGGAPVGLIAVLIALLVVGALCIACFLVVKKKIKDGNQNSRLVILYQKCPWVKSTSNQSEPGNEEPAVDAENGEAGNQTKDACPTLAVKPMVQENGNHQANGGTADTIPYTDLSLAVTADEQNDSCTPLMSSEDTSAAVTDVKSVES